MESGRYPGKFAAMKCADWLGIIVALILAFGGGAEWYAWRTREALKLTLVR